MNWVLVKIQESSVLSPYPPPSPPLAQASNHDSGGAFNLNSKVSPSILLIIIILAIIFFISGLLHLLVRFLLRPQNRDPDDLDSVTALQGQLQQLFHLHDSGVDQSFIDTLPVFNYKSIIGLKNYPFDCAVCLCEFELEDKLRLLPKCSHAFHMECIDTWLLSHSTCPLCRASLLSDFSSSNNNYGCSPVVLVLESGSESSREIVTNHSHELGRTNSISISRLSLSSHYEDVVNASDLAQKGKSCEIQEKTEEGEEKVVHVKLGKFKNVDPIEGEEGISSNNIDSRRCFSMGSFAYVLDETTSLHVPIRTNTTLKKASNKTPLLTQGLIRSAVSECGCDSRRDFNGFEAFKIAENPINNGDESKILGKSSKKESFSVSKIWLREKKDDETNSRRAFSFRFPVSRNNVDAAVHGGAGGGGGAGRRTVSEVDVGKWVNGGGSCDEENQSYNSMECQPKTPSFARRTILWLMGRQNKVVHSSFSSNL